MNLVKYLDQNIIKKKKGLKKTKVSFSKKAVKKSLRKKNREIINKMKEKYTNATHSEISSCLKTDVKFVNTHLNNLKTKNYFQNITNNRKKKMFSTDVILLLKDFIKNEYTNKPLTSIRDLKIRFEDKVLKNLPPSAQLKRSFSLSTYRRHLKSKKGLNLSYKKFARYGENDSNEPEKKEIRKDFASKFSYYLYMGLEMVFIDESSFNVNFFPSYGWTTRGMKARIKFIGKKSHNVSLLASISKNRLLCFQLFKGSVTGHDFFKFLINMHKSGFLDPTKYCLILDNCMTRHKKEYIDYFRSKFNILFLPHYSPFLNSIELFFNVLKKKLRTRLMRQ